MKQRILEICLARAYAYLPKHEENFCHFTFIVQNNKIVEWGINRRLPPLIHLGYADHTMMHSETHAYFKAKGILDKKPFDAVNIRITRKGKKVSQSKPCNVCKTFLASKGCNKIWFTDWGGNFDRVKA